MYISIYVYVCMYVYTYIHIYIYIYIHIHAIVQQTFLSPGPGHLFLSGGGPTSSPTSAPCTS